MSKKTSSGSKGISTKRQSIREKRRRQKKNQQIIILIGIVVIGLIIAGFLILPDYLTPVGEFVTITPHERPMEDGRAMGDPNAPVTIEVFEDFQCSGCKFFSEDIEPQIVDAYVANGSVRYIFRQFPFLDDRSPRKESDQAATASMCAADQNRFWDYHDMLFANSTGQSQQFSDKRLLAFADALELDMESFTQCFNANLHQDEIDADLAQGREAGMSGTPSIFVNGKIVKRANANEIPLFEDISQAVEAELTKSGN